MQAIRDFLARDEGAVTVDWVVLTAAMVAIAVLAATAMQDGVEGTTGLISSLLLSWTY